MEDTLPIFSKKMSNKHKSKAENGKNHFFFFFKTRASNVIITQIISLMKRMISLTALLIRAAVMNIKRCIGRNIKSFVIANLLHFYFIIIIIFIIKLKSCRFERVNKSERRD